MAFKRLSSEDLAKLELVKEISLEELTELITNKDSILKKYVNLEDVLNSNLSIVPIPSIPINTIPTFEQQYSV